MRLATLSIMFVVVAGSHAVDSYADPLHKIGTEGAWQHEGSGWIFSKRIEESDRIGVPYTIDGNDDVGVQYDIPADLARATVEIFRSDSAASGAQLPPPEAMQDGPDGTGMTQAPFTADARGEITGVKLGFEAPGGSHHRHYRFETTDWIVVIRALAPAGPEADHRLDTFVRALPWQTLGTDTSALHDART